MKSFDSVLVANRGEIAVRVIRTAQLLGLRTIAVFSDVDASAPHVTLADDAVCIGSAPVVDSYLNIESIIGAAKQTGAQSVHPGYGFLSENPAFAARLDACGLVFIGPSAQAIELMGNKAAAKRRMIQANVPCVPGYEQEDQADDTLIQAAHRIGFPVMVKATAGGGGRGMRLVNSPNQLVEALASARSEALHSFGSDKLIIERAITNARHVEIQVFADNHGNVIHLGERDCSVQRRHQKVIEEAPCPVVSDSLRNAMGQAAIQATRSIHYSGAGTIEFLLNDQNEFFFLEMNTRLQVEHPVTEMVTGLDLVKLQFLVADGQELPVKQHDITLNGHAIEARLYAEDPGAEFLPAIGTIEHWRPFENESVRFDSGIESGSQVSPYYDPLLAKVVARGSTRDEARRGLLRALQMTELFGITTNRSFLIDLLQRPTFADGQATTQFIEQEFGPDELADQPPDNPQIAMAAILSFVTQRDRAHRKSVAVPECLLNWFSGDEIWSSFRFADEKLDVVARVHADSQNCYRVEIADHALAVSECVVDAREASFRIDGRRRIIGFASLADGRMQIVENGKTLTMQSWVAGANDASTDNGSGRVVAPMHGVLVDVFVKVADTITTGDRLAVMEAMKMQHDLRAGVDGTVVAVSAKVGTQVSAGDLVVEIEVGKE